MRLNNVAPQWTWDASLSTGIVAVVVVGLGPLFGWALAGERWIILGALSMVALVPVFVRWPVVSTFGVYALLVPFDSVTALAGTGGATLVKFAGMLAGAVLVVTGLMERRFGRPPLAALWWSLFMVWGVLSAGWAINPEALFGRLQVTLSLFALYLVAVSFRPSRNELYSVCVLVVIGGAMAATLGYLYGHEDLPGNAARGRLVLGDQGSNPNLFGATLVLPLALATAGVVGSRSTLQRTMVIGLVGVIGAGIYISMSRAALLALIVTISVILYRIGLKWKIVAPAVVLSALAGVMPDRFYERVGALFTGEDATGSGRTEIWAVGLKALEEFGFFGAGLANFPEAYRLHAASGFSGRAAHNSYLMIWVEVGFLGLVLVFAALGSHLLAVHRARKTGHGGVVLAALEAACLGGLAYAFFGDVLWRKNFWLAWTLLTWATYCDRSPTQQGIRDEVGELSPSHETATGPRNVER